MDNYNKEITEFVNGLQRYMLLIGLITTNVEVGAFNVGFSFLVLIRQCGDRLVGIRLCNSTGEDIEV